MRWLPLWSVYKYRRCDGMRELQCGPFPKQRRPIELLRVRRGLFRVHHRAQRVLSLPHRNLSVKHRKNRVHELPLGPIPSKHWPIKLQQLPRWKFHVGEREQRVLFVPGRFLQLWRGRRLLHLVSGVVVLRHHRPHGLRVVRSWSIQRFLRRRILHRLRRWVLLRGRSCELHLLP